MLNNLVLVSLNHDENPINRKATLFLPNLGIDSIYTNLQIKFSRLRLNVVDGFLNNFNTKQTFEKILELNPEAVGFSTTHVNLEEALQISKLIKKMNSNIIIIIGGPGSKSLHFMTKGETIDSVDYCIEGDGEKILEEIIHNGKKQLKTIYIRLIIKNLDSLEFPYRECFDIEKYIKINSKINSKVSTDKERALNIYTSKGCDWAKCTYCTVSKNYRARSPENIKLELDYLVKKFNINKVFIVDDNFFTLKNVNRLENICNVLSCFPDLKWETETRVMDFVKDIDLSKRILQKMKKSGCSNICWGVESGDNGILETLKKGISTENIEKAISLASKFGIPSRLFIMFNLPGETEESLTNTLLFLKKLFAKYYINLIRVSRYINIPGLSSCQSMEKQCNIQDETLNIFKNNLNNLCAENNIVINYFKY